MAKIKTYLTTVTITKTVTKQIKATSPGAAILRLKDHVKAYTSPIIDEADFGPSDASEIVTIYQTGDK
jgi:hypothetical protein